MNLILINAGLVSESGFTHKSSLVTRGTAKGVSICTGFTVSACMNRIGTKYGMQLRVIIHD